MKFNTQIGELALNLHKNRTEELVCELPSGCQLPARSDFVYFTVENSMVSFASIEARNRYIARHVFETNRKDNNADSQMWLKTAHEIWRHEIGKDDKASGRLLALVHAKSDIFSIASNAIANKYMEVFKVLHVVQAALPYLAKVKPDGIISLCAAQYELTKNDLAAGHFFSHLEMLLSAHPGICCKIHKYLRSNISDSIANLHSVSILALAKAFPEESLALAYEDYGSSKVILKRVSIWTLGRLLKSSHVKETALPSVSGTIIACMRDPDEQIRRPAILAAAQLLTIMDVFDAPLFSLGESQDQNALAAIAHTLIVNTQEMKEKVNFREWVLLLCKLPSSAGSLGNFDCLLSQLLREKDNQQLAITCLTEWASINSMDIPRDKSVTKLFDSTVFELAKRQELLSQVITDWLLSDSRQLASAAAGMLSHLWSHEVHDVEFYVPRIDMLWESDLLYLARRMLGFVYSESHLISLTLSLLKTNNPQQRVFDLVFSILVTELGQDYPELTIKALDEEKARTTDDEWTAFLDRAINAITNRMNAIESLPRLMELRPSQCLQRQFFQAHAKQMNSMIEDSRKDSIIRQIATEIPIKAGRGMFSYRDGSYTETCQMQPYSHAVALPRRHILDSVGYDISHLGFRVAKRDDA